MNIHTLITTLILFVSLSACYEEDDNDKVLFDRAAPGKGFYPVSGNTFTNLNNPTNTTWRYAGGSDLALELVYWTEDRVKEVNMYATLGTGPREKVYAGQYAEIAAFSRMKSADTLILRYTVPTVAAETTIKLEMEIINENTLTLTRSRNVTAIP
ncbi:hypothetical protein KK062_21540 [Fulvivirgaceae bacterium PWU5]|uniref:Uncharacterized protein n=1 Tax=Dawidia cretensis TaxID=2782350 RepID=A0AAP2E0B7_9BACT|nr:hypothetical protein [Dawidia cretensis]MBT1710840.1 hypothetical protein [Dawidia cretensis]